MRCQVDLDPCRDRPDLTAWVEHPRVADPVRPRAVGLERRFVNVTGEDDVRTVIGDPPREIGVPVVPACPSSSWASRRVASGTPRSSSSGGAPLSASSWSATVCRPRPVPPWADRDQGVADHQRVAVGDDPDDLASASHSAAASPLASRPLRSWLPDDTMTGTSPLEQFEVPQHHHDLRVALHARTDVEVVAGEHDQVELRRGVHQPVELPQRIVQVRDDEDAHGQRARRRPCRAVSTARGISMLRRRKIASTASSASLVGWCPSTRSSSIAASRSSPSS